MKSLVFVVKNPHTGMVLDRIIDYVPMTERTIKALENAIRRGYRVTAMLYTNQYKANSGGNHV